MAWIKWLTSYNLKATVSKERYGKLNCDWDDDKELRIWELTADVEPKQAGAAKRNFCFICLTITELEWIDL